MRKIPTAAIEAGMVLAKPVRGPNGNILLNAGAALQSGMANRLQSWGIPVVYVEGDPEEEGEQVSAKKVDPAEIERILTERFGDTRSDPLMDMIFRATLNYLMEKGQS